MQAHVLPPSEAGPVRRFAFTQERILGILLLLELVFFSMAGRNFLSGSNLILVLRLGSELGLLAVLMTPVIMTGGIDLSVGSLMGLCAVLFGKLWRDGGLSVALVAPLTVLIGAAAGGLNALLITRFRIPPLIVTLGTYSLFRGLAEGLTHGTDNFTNFPPGFLSLGQGELFGLLPSQFPLFVAVAGGVWLLVHRTGVGRSLFAIGFSPDGARYAGIPVERRLALVYVLSGMAAALASVVYVAFVGQAKADAALGYELTAITAVVLGGTSIFGGRGSVHGTILGLFALVLLKNGLQLSGVESEAADILTGLLLLLAIGARQGVERLESRRRPLIGKEPA